MLTEMEEEEDVDVCKMEDVKTKKVAPQDDGKVKIDSLTCSLCLGLICEPITIPCGHTFCRVCLYLAMQRSKKKCPNCRAVCHVEPSTHAVNIMLAKIARKCYPAEYSRRLEEAEKEKQKFEQTLPVFFYNNCLFPGGFLHLHLFEQRYRHMINRCVSSNRKFIYLPNFSDYKASDGDVGLMAYVDECEFLPDGRALLKAKIQQRVQVSNSWVEEGTQGLHYCQIRAFEEENKEMDADEMKDIVNLADNFLKTVPGLREKIVRYVGKQPSPSQPTKWSFWFAALVTMISRAGQNALPLLKTKSTSERLKISREMFTQLLAQAQGPKNQGSSDENSSNETPQSEER